jgi:hypothetical protein
VFSAVAVVFAKQKNYSDANQCHITAVVTGHRAARGFKVDDPTVVTGVPRVSAMIDDVETEFFLDSISESDTYTATPVGTKIQIKYIAPFHPSTAEKDYGKNSFEEIFPIAVFAFFGILTGVASVILIILGINSLR